MICNTLYGVYRIPRNYLLIENHQVRIVRSSERNVLARSRGTLLIVLGALSYDDQRI